MTSTDRAARAVRRSRSGSASCGSARSCAVCATSSPTSRSRRSAILEDEGLLRPQRTPGRLPAVQRARCRASETILRLQRDEFLPLRVIRDELDAPGRDGAQAPPAGRRSARREEAIDLDELCRRAGDRRRAREGARGLRPARAARAAAETSAIPRPTPTSRWSARSLTRFGVDARHLRTFRTATDRQAALLEQLFAPALRSPQQRAPRAGAARSAGAHRARRRSCRRSSTGATCETCAQ